MNSSMLSNTLSDLFLLSNTGITPTYKQPKNPMTKSIESGNDNTNDCPGVIPELSNDNPNLLDFEYNSE